MVIEFTQCVLSGFVNRSIFDRLLLGRGKERVLFYECGNANKEVACKLTFWAWAFFYSLFF